MPANDILLNRKAPFVAYKHPMNEYIATPARIKPIEIRVIPESVSPAKTVMIPDNRPAGEQTAIAKMLPTPI